MSLDPAADDADAVLVDDDLLCRYCGTVIEERDQVCPALHAGRCEP